MYGEGPPLVGRYGPLYRYWRAGFVHVARFGEYLGSPLSLCMGKDLT